MNTDREQPLNPPGWDAPERKIKRQYVPMREYDNIEANGYNFSCIAVVESCDKRDEDLRVAEGSSIMKMWCEVWDKMDIPSKFLDSYISTTGPTWRELIEREICRQARELPGTAWKVEYEGDIE